MRTSSSGRAIWEEFVLSISRYPFKLGCFKFRILIVISWQSLKKTNKKTLKKYIQNDKRIKTVQNNRKKWLKRKEGISGRSKEQKSY